MKPILIITTLLAFTCQQYAIAEDSRNSGEIVDSARVLNVEPLYETISYTEPHRECHYEERVVKHYDSKTPVILGTLIGGAIGNELGHREINKKVGTVAGAILGGSIAKDLTRNKHRGHHVTTEKVCTTTHHVNYKEEITGYNVTYKYRGRTFTTFMDTPPGDRIKVAVSVRPL